MTASTQPPKPCETPHRWHNDVAAAQVPPESDWCIACGAMRARAPLERQQEARAVLLAPKP